MKGYSTSRNVKIINETSYCTATLGSGVSYDTDAQSYFTRAGITDTTEKNAVNTLVLALKSDGLWTKMLALYLISPTSIGASLHNAVSSSFLATVTASPSHSPTGWTFDGMTQFVKSGIIPNTHLTLNSTTSFYYNRTNAQSGGTVFGASQSSTQQYSGRPRSTTTDLANFSAYSNATAFTGSSTNASGYFFHSITASNNRFIRRNNASIASNSSANGGTQPTIEVYLGARNNTGTADAFVAYEIATFGQSNVGLTTAECDTLYTRLSTYNANVISGGR